MPAFSSTNRNLQNLGGELLTLVCHHVATKWEPIHFCIFPIQVKPVHLGSRDTFAEGRLCIWLVLAIPVTPGGEPAHGDTRIFSGTLKGKNLFYEPALL